VSKNEALAGRGIGEGKGQLVLRKKLNLAGGGGGKSPPRLRKTDSISYWELCLVGGGKRSRGYRRPESSMDQRVDPKSW